MRVLTMFGLSLACLLPCAVARGQSAPASGKIAGVAYDSVRARPMAKAAIQLAFESDPSISRQTQTDDRGRFRVDSLLPGFWLIGATDQHLDSLAIERLTLRINVQAKGTTRTVLATPSLSSTMRYMCGVNVANDSAGLLFGMLRDVRSPALGASGTVRVDWLDLELSRGQLTRTLRTVEAKTRAEGMYFACGVPPGGVLRVRASNATDSSGVLETMVPVFGIGRLDLLVGAARAVSSTVRSVDADSVADTTTVTLMRGAGRVQGVVRGKGGLPLANARVSVWGTGLDATTSADGSFTLRELPTGSHTLETRAIGYQAERRIIDLLDAEPTLVSSQLESLASLDTVRVRAIRKVYGRDMAGFEERRRQGLGRFIDEETIAKRQAFRTTDLLRTMAGVRVVPSGSGTRVLMRGGTSGACAPTVFIDRMRMQDSDLDTFIDPSIIRGIEVYTAMTTPPEFFSLSGCGSVVIWTGSRQR